MKYIKKIYREIRRNIQSYIVYLRIYILNIKNNKKTEYLFKMSFNEVHVVCPGPSAVDLLKQDLDENSAIIFVNHAVKMASQVNGPAKLFYFSADATRTLEVLTQNSEEINKCLSILAPWHLFHMSKFSLYKKLDIVLLPKVRVTSKYGLETIDSGPDNFSKLAKNPNGSGFGTFVYSLKLAILFSPNKIILWGCDFGHKSGRQYFDKTTPMRTDTPFELIRRHFFIIKEKINKMGIEVL